MMIKLKQVSNAFYSYIEALDLAFNITSLGRCSKAGKDENAFRYNSSAYYYAQTIALLMDEKSTFTDKRVGKRSKFMNANIITTLLKLC